MTCLSVSTDGSVLLSGSHDESVRLWDVKSKQCLRTVTLKGVHEASAATQEQGKEGLVCQPGPDVVLLCPSGPVTNAAIMLAPPSMLNPEFRPSLPLPHFNKHLLGAEHGDEAQGGGLRLQLGLHMQVHGALHDAHPASPNEIIEQTKSMAHHTLVCFLLTWS